MSARWPRTDRRPAVPSVWSADSTDDDKPVTPTVAEKESLENLVSTPINSPKQQSRRPLHEPSPSQNNRLSGIRVVPYSPVRLAPDETVGSNSPHRWETLPSDDDDDKSKAKSHDKAASPLPATPALPTSSTSPASPTPGSARTSSETVRKRLSRGNRASWGSLLAATAAGAGLGSPTASSPGRTSRSSDSNATSNKTVSGRVGKKASGRLVKKLQGSPLWRPNEEKRSPLVVTSNKGVSEPKSVSGLDHSWTWPAQNATSLPPTSAVHASSAKLAELTEHGHDEIKDAQNRTRSGTLASSSSLSLWPPPPLTSSSVHSPSASVTSFTSTSPVPRPISRRRNVIAVHADKTFSLVPRLSIASSSSSPSIPLPSLSLSNSSHERFISDTFSTDDRPSSPLTSLTIRDHNSQSPRLFIGLQGFDRDPLIDPVAWNPNYRLPTALRKLPPTDSTPDQDLKGKLVSPDFSTAASTVTSLSSAYYLNHPLRQHPHLDATALNASATLLPPLAESSSPVTEIAARSITPPSAARLAAQNKSSFGSETESSHSFSASTLSANTNYKVYTRSSPPADPADHGSADSRHNFEQTPSPIDSLGSADSFGNTTNIEILGHSSPPSPEPQLPTLRPSIDPDETFASLSSYDETDPNVVVLSRSTPPDASQASASPAPSVRSSPPVFRPHTSDTEDSEPNYVLYRQPVVPYVRLSDLAGPSAPSAPSAPSEHATHSEHSGYSAHSAPYILFNELLEPSEPYILQGEGSESSTRRVSQPRPFTASSTVSSLAIVSQPQYPNFSQESLVIPPLQPNRNRSSERIGYLRSRSRESLHRAASIRSISSLTLNQEVASTFFAGQAFLNLNFAPVPVFTSVVKQQPQQPQSRTPGISITTTVPKRKPVPGRLSSTLPTPIEDEVLEDTTPGKRLHSHSMQEYPHQWSSQLSTVMSESEIDSIDSRVVSARTNSMSTRHLPSSSAHSRNMPSISSSLALQLEDSRSQRSRSNSLVLDRAQAVYMGRNTLTGSPPVVRDVDEHGDGLTDLDAMHGTLMRQQLALRSAGFTNGSSSSSSNNSGNRSSNHSRSLSSNSRGLHSSGSSRSLSGVIPQWARVYYGSGERKWLANPNANISQSDLGSVVGDDGAHGRFSRLLHSPSSYLYNPRRRPREGQAKPGPNGERPFSDGTSIIEMGGSTDPAGHTISHGLRTKASSVWSPHLRMDRRAARFSMWDPPSMTWSTESSAFDRRNRQVVAFVVGFVFPFAWMLAAVMPLPPDPKTATEKRPEADTEIGIPAVLEQRMVLADEARFQSARWWRMLNRVFAGVGVLVIVAVIVVAVVCVRQGWAQ